MGPVGVHSEAMEELMVSKIAVAAGLAFGLSVAAQAALPVYGNPGVENPTANTFVKLSDGDLVAYFVGATAGLINDLGVFAGATDLGTGLSNADPLGTSFNYGFVAAGTTLTFYINTSDGDTFSSDKTLNADGLNHAYSASYAGGDTIGLATFAPGNYVYVGFEDLPDGGDLDYDDIQFVFEDTVVPEPATWAMMITGFGLVGFAARRRRTAVAAA